jgi:O-antigen ligase
LLRGRTRAERWLASQRRADVIILILSVYLLLGPGGGAYSATSILITVVGVTFYLAASRLQETGVLVLRNLKVIVVACVLIYVTLGESATASVGQFLNRSADLTGRATDIWPAVLAMAARHPILGAGYGNAWGLGGELSQTVQVEQAHNGYLDVYLQLGIVGCTLLAFFFLNWCSRIQSLGSVNFEWGMFGACFLLMTLIYNLSETGFFDTYTGTAMVLIVFAFAGACDNREAAVRFRKRTTLKLARTLN